MKEIMTQDQRLDYLVEEFKTDSVQYENLQTPGDTEGKRRILRSLMNVRMPRQMPESILAVQDEYLQGRAEEKGIVHLADIPLMKDGMSIWQGDITRLADAGTPYDLRQRLRTADSGSDAHGCL